MDYVWYLFRFDGRINRARCWLSHPSTSRTGGAASVRGAHNRILAFGDARR